MRIGINLMLFTGWPTVRDVDVVQAMKSIGYDFVEVPVIDPADHKWPALGKMLNGEGMGCTISSALPPGTSLALDNPTAARATDFHWRLIDTARTLGATLVSGALYHAPYDFTEGDAQSELVDKLAGRIGYLSIPYLGANVRLAIEPLNRYESSVLNTCAAAATAVSRTKADWLGVCTDTYHMHIEEKSLAALDALGPRWIHAHASENDHGALGSGQVGWGAWADAVRRNQFAGDVVACAYSLALPHLARTARIWRDVAADPLEIAKNAFTFIKGLLAGA